MSGENWSCPHCDRDQVVVNEAMQDIEHHIRLKEKNDDSYSLCGIIVQCANRVCRKLTVILSIRPDRPHKEKFTFVVDYDDEPLFLRRVIPNSAAKPQPDYIPHVLREDYNQACLIVGDSPKAAATLARRCLQGMIRDFCGISKRRLIDEIKALRTAIDDGSAPRSVTIESVDAIDHVRGIGNIGAHLERDINVIVEVDPNEAQLLIELIELLFSEWYVERYNRQQRLASITALGQSKEQEKLDARATPVLLAPLDDSTA